MTTTAAQLSSAPTAQVTGIWQRHVPARFSHTGLQGRRSAGRWGTRNGFPVLYLGKPEQSVVIEAYRHLVDPVEDPMPPGSFVPRMLITASVEVDNVLDLRTAGGRAAAGLTMAELQSATSDREAYRQCQLVAQLAHQLRYHGIVAPAATKVGETLALFTDVVPANQQPVHLADEHWDTLPQDPRNPGQRRLRLIGPSDT
ncbi:RES domain-containing protein [Klenkia marina]|uniref:RES domain-containing protein n=1 Tax=Klenkia marina TaxID=1960309 RepID=A0A1G4Z4E7_9ACTN|nr:RES domain-containing protein [Klenkia marina]SCX60571.1 RES domain-containing protein [Klenkia marina]